MPYLPYNFLFSGPECTIVISGSLIQALSNSEGKVLASADSISIVRAAAVTSDFSHLITAGDDKQLKVWNLIIQNETSRITEESSRELPKKSLEIHVTSDGQTILSSDKFGDIYSYPMRPALDEVPQSENDTAQEGGKHPISGHLLLGHASIVTSFILTPDENFVISGDRDEHIRVSWYPQGYNIERFCLGHRKYISALHVPSFQPSILISGGGDHELCIWDWKSGWLLHRYPVYEVAEPFIKVRGGRRGFRRIPRRPDGEGLSRKSKRGKAKRKAAESAAETPNDDDIEMADEQDGSTSGVVEHEDPTPLEQPEQDPTEISFVISKINSLSYGSSNFIVFTAVGISAFFYFQIHADGNCSALRLVDLVYPVVDFNICQSSPGPSILISVDHNVKGTHATATDSVTTDGRWVYLLAWNGAELEVQPDSPLCNGLNTTARVDATEDTLTKLELYVSLSNLPKSREELVEDSGGGVDSDSLGASAASERTTPITDPFATQKEHTIKAKGRNRVRDKLLQNQQSGYGLSLPTSKNESPASRESSEPEQKRVKVDADAPV